MAVVIYYQTDWLALFDAFFGPREDAQVSIIG